MNTEIIVSYIENSQAESKKFVLSNGIYASLLFCDRFKECWWCNYYGTINCKLSVNDIFFILQNTIYEKEFKEAFEFCKGKKLVFLSISNI
jgi:hypothetical protein